jgi:hypothetical protein
MLAGKLHVYFVTKDREKCILSDNLLMEGKMRRGFFLFLLLSVLGSSVAFAGVPNLEGEWSGYFVAIYADGSTEVVENEMTSAVIMQNAEYPNLFHGYMTFVTSMGEFTRNFTGYISVDKRISINMFELETEMVEDEEVTVVNPVAIIEGHLTGKTINGVVRDFTDTTTTMFIATKEGSDEMDPEEESEGLDSEIKTKNIPRGRAKGRSK